MGQVFCTRGPVPPDSPTYVERAADRELRQRLLAMNYAWLAEPPRMGKTSLLYRLRAQPISYDYTLAYVDLEGLDRGSEARWYRGLCSRLAPQLEGAAKGLPEVGDRPGFGHFLRCLAERAAVIRGDAFRTLDRLAECGPFDLVFLDPPYRYFTRPGRLLELLEALGGSSYLADGGLVIVQHDKRTALPERIGRLGRSDLRNYGNTSVTFLARTLS